MSVNDPTMESQHHPDCGWLQGPFPHRPMDDREPLFCMDCLTECICDRLRKAEQRGVKAARDVVAALSWLHRWADGVVFRDIDRDAALAAIDALEKP